MTPVYDESGIKIFEGDALSVLASLPAESAQTCVTSPPYYGLRDYGLPPLMWGGAADCKHRFGQMMSRHRGGPQGKGGQRAGRDVTAQNATADVQTGTFCLRCGGWRGSLGLEPSPDLYVAHMVEVLREVRRVLRSDGSLWLNLGDSYASGKGTCYNPGGGENSLSGHKGLKAEQAYPLNRGNKSTLAISGLKPKDLFGIPWAVAFALRADGWYLRSDIVWAKPNPMPESVEDRPTKAHEYIFLLARSERYYFDADAIKEPAVSAEEAQWDNGQNGLCGGVSYQGQGTSTRKFAKRKDLPETQVDHGGNPELHNAHQGFGVPWEGVTRKKRSVWTVQAQPYPDAHFATFPPKLIEPCILAGSKTGDVILDPFHGAGTTAMVSKELGRRYIGAELNADYIAMSTKRLRQEVLPL